MNANELAKLLEVDSWYKLVTREEIATMLRQQQAEIEALKMGFANSGTHDSELAETRAMAGRLFLKVQNLEFEQEGYENLTEMLESEKAELTEKNCQQQAEIEALKKQVDRKDNSIMALDMMIAQFEDKFGDYEKVINGVYSKVKPHEFIEAVKGKENIVGTPIMYAEWPIRNDK